MDYGHWKCDFDFEPDEWFGFIYRVIDHRTGMQYIGKKQLTKVRRKPTKGKRRKVIRAESDWRSYTGSSEHLNEAIALNGKDNFTFVIESLHKTKASLHYAEIEVQVIEDVLRARLDDGSRKFYNRAIGNVRFIPPPETLEEAAHKRRSGVSGVLDHADDRHPPTTACADRPLGGLGLPV
jgi:hypothetical protein